MGAGPSTTAALPWPRGALALPLSCGIAAGLVLSGAAVVFGRGMGSRREEEEEGKREKKIGVTGDGRAAGDALRSLRRQLEEKQRMIDYLGRKIASSGGGPPRTKGYMESPWPDRRSTPRQGERIRTDHLKGSLDDLEDFSHVWLVWVFHKNTRGIKPSKEKDPFSGGMGLRAKIRVPRLRMQKKKAGLFSTRTPHRPNPIGLSLCKIILVDKKRGEILLSGVDLISGTPILDVKPYIPYSDSPGGLANTRVPIWIRAPAAIDRVTWTEIARKQLSSLVNSYLEIFSGDVKLASSTLEEAVTNEAVGRPLFIRKLPEGTHPDISSTEDRKMYRIRMGSAEATYLILTKNAGSKKSAESIVEAKDNDITASETCERKEILILSVSTVNEEN